MILLTKKGCHPCARTKEALAASSLPEHQAIQVLTFDLADDLQWQEWKQRRHLLGFDTSPVLVDGDKVIAAGIMAISKALGLTI